VPPTWQEREGPLLAALADLEDERGSGDLDLDEAALRAQLPRDEVTKAAVRLIDAGYVAGTITRLGSEPEPAVIVSQLTERGLRAVGIWPSGDDDMLASVLGILDELAGGSTGRRAGEPLAPAA